jgi:hypothetical protein
MAVMFAVKLRKRNSSSVLSRFEAGVTRGRKKNLLMSAQTGFQSALYPYSFAQQQAQKSLSGQCSPISQSGQCQSLPRQQIISAAHLPCAELHPDYLSAAGSP